LSIIYWHNLPVFICEEIRKQDQLILEHLVLPIKPRDSIKIKQKQTIEQKLLNILQELKNIQIVTPNELIIFIIFIIPKRNINEELKKIIEERLKRIGIKDIIIVDNNNFHDRFWVFSKNLQTVDGFVMGTSLNGLGCKIAILKTLDKDELSDLEKERKKAIANNTIFIYTTWYSNSPSTSPPPFQYLQP
jgi:hypothetical protein